jgi:hypothetical protein
MNKRLKELAEQSTTIEYGVDNGFDRVTFDKEKFAKLIIDECVQVTMNAKSKEAAAMIVTHFGVNND